MEKRWNRIDVVVPEEDAEAIAFDVAEALGVGVELIDDGFRFYVDAAVPNDLWEGKLRRILAEFGDQRPERADAVEVRMQDMAEDDWADRWKLYFKPLRVGRRFLICPTWEESVPEVGDCVILMDPGRAFGTGHHETTRLCLEWLEDRAETHRADATSLLDLGTGSGILAMGAALLGFGRVFAIDNDEEAVEVARENLRVNGLEGRIVLSAGSLGEVDQNFDVVVANLQANPLTEMALALSDRLQPEGMLVLSGILIEQEQTVCSAYEDAGMTFVERRSAGEWSLLAFRHQPST
jgi:ribosomal protein L11 methyltransferase